MGDQTKKKTRSFSLTGDEFSRILASGAAHGFADRNEYLLALEEAARRLGLMVTLNSENRKVLDLPLPIRMVAESAAAYGADKISTAKFDLMLEAAGKAARAKKAEDAARRAAHK